MFQKGGRVNSGSIEGRAGRRVEAIDFWGSGTAISVTTPEDGIYMEDVYPNSGKVVQAVANLAL
jgi:hypothetical protein